MARLFPHIEEHKRYPSTFLMKVEWRLYFTLPGNTETYLAFAKFVKDTFDLELKREDYDAMGILPLRYERNDNSAAVKITYQFAEFSFEANGYSSFADSAKDILYSFIHTIYSASGHITHLMTNKKNLVMLKRNFEGEEQEILSLVLSDDLLHYPHKVLREADFTADTLPSTHFFTAEMDGNIVLQVLYGAYSTPSVTEYQGMQLMEYGVMIESQCDYDLSLDSIATAIRVVEEMNDAMYDFIHWAFMPEIIHTMEIEPIDGRTEYDVEISQ